MRLMNTILGLLFCCWIAPAYSAPPVEWTQRYEIKEGEEFRDSAILSSGNSAVFVGDTPTEQWGIDWKFVKMTFEGVTTNPYGTKYDDKIFSVIKIKDGYAMCGISGERRGIGGYIAELNHDGLLQRHEIFNYLESRDEVFLGMMPMSQEGRYLAWGKTSLSNSWGKGYVTTASFGRQRDYFARVNGGAWSYFSWIIPMEDSSYLAIGVEDVGDPRHSDSDGVARKLKFSQGWEEEWNQMIGTIGSEDQLYHAIKLEERYAVVGSIDVGNSFRVSGFLCFINKNGDTSYAEVLKEEYFVNLTSISKTKDKKVITTGSILNETDGKTLLIKYNLDAEIIWEQSFEGFSTNPKRVVYQCEDGGFLIGGQIAEPAFSAEGYTYLIKTDENGELEWKKWTDFALETVPFIDETEDGYFVGLKSDKELRLVKIRKEESSAVDSWRLYPYTSVKG